MLYESASLGAFRWDPERAGIVGTSHGYGYFASALPTHHCFRSRGRPAGCLRLPACSDVIPGDLILACAGREAAADAGDRAGLCATRTDRPARVVGGARHA